MMQKVKLEDICQINMGKTPSRDQPQYWGGKHTWVAIADLKGDVLISKTKEGITDIALQESGIKPVFKGTLLYSFKLSIGKVAITDKTLYTNEAIVALPIKDSKQVDLKYLYYAIQQIDLTGIGDKAVKGITLNKEKLKRLEIPLPPLLIQQQIAEILDKADTLRRKDRELLKQYDALAHAIFIEMFGDPVRNEKGWQQLSFNDLFETRLGKMLDAKKQIGKVRYKYLGNSNVQWFRFQLDNLLEMEFDEKELKTFELKQNDILICEGGEVGRAAIWNNEMSNVFFQKAIHRARIKTNNITPLYTVMLLWFLAKYGGLKDYVTASTIAHLTGEKLKTLPIPLPPYEQQIRFSQHIESLNEQKRMLKIGLKQSETLFQSLLQQAFDGSLLESKVVEV